MRWFAATVLMMSTAVLADDKPALDVQVNKAIKKATAFLLSKQKESGAFASHHYSLAATALAMDALISAGHKYGKGKEGQAIAKGLAFVLKAQKPATGLFGGKQSHAMMYEHGICTRLLAKLVRQKLPKDVNKQCRAALEKAVMLILKAQTTKGLREGGWRYQPVPRDGDLSVTVWQTTALFAAKEAKVKVPEKALERAMMFAIRCAPQKGGFSYMPRYSFPSVSMSGAGCVILLRAGKSDRKEFGKAVSFIAKSRVQSSKWWVYSAPHVCEAVFGGGKEGREYATTKLLPQLLKEQRKDGSWDGRSLRTYGPEIPTTRALEALSIARRKLTPPKKKEPKK